MEEVKKQKQYRPWRAVVPALTGIALLAACAGPKTLYQWESYQPQVYEYFKGEPKQAQIEALERDMQKIAAAGATPPPGYHAHLGLLYAGIGKDDQMVSPSVLGRWRRGRS